MPRLTPEKIEQHQEWLSEWHSPTEVLAYVGDVNEFLGRYLFIQAGLAFLRDAWSSATFGHIRGASTIRLIEGEWPDAELRFNDSVEPIECTEADVPGRRRGEEYREAEDKAGPYGLYVEDDPVENWIARAETAPEALRLAAEKKVAKTYSGKTHFLIYLNISEFGIQQNEIKACFLKSTEPAKDAFETVWILWKAAVYKVWDMGKPSDVCLRKEPVERS